MNILNFLQKTSDKKKKRLGRGYGSGKGGHTTNRGQKGQKSRVGTKIPLWFEGGQLPLIKRVPMLRGKGRFKVVRPVAEITFNHINHFDFDVVSLETLKANKIIDSAFKKAKIVKKGKLKKKIAVRGVGVTKGAIQEIERLGGTIEK
jgi:large subunit ribosomal protein L15